MLTDSYRCCGIIHRERAGGLPLTKAQLTVNNSGRTMGPVPKVLDLLILLPVEFAARPGKRITGYQRLTLSVRASSPDVGLCSMTNTQELFACSRSDECYKVFARREQVGSST